jgi:hypothetical protein
MVFKKNILLGLLLLSLPKSCHADLSNLTVSKIINYFDAGYCIGVRPLLWRYVPQLAQGSGLGLTPKVQIWTSGDEKIAYWLGVLGFAAGVSVIVFALYGLKKFFSKPCFSLNKKS